MPQAKLKPSDVAAEAKRTYIPYIEQRLPQFPAQSYVYPDSSKLRPHHGSPNGMKRKLRVAVIDGDPVDVALDWYDYNIRSNAKDCTAEGGNAGGRIPVVNMANEKRAGGDWESGLVAPEECLCRRSNLVHALTTPSKSTTHSSHYPLQTTGGIYSPHVVVFRSTGDRGYSVWKDFKSLPIISVAPVRRPKLDESGESYSFEQEKELMKEKMRTVLRIAAFWHHTDLCMGAFGVGPSFRNPVRQVALMWKDILFLEPEFEGVFENIVFAVETTAADSSKGGPADHDTFKEIFDPKNIVRTTFR